MRFKPGTFYLIGIILNIPNHNNSGELHQCNVCTKSFQTQNTLVLHIKSVHGGKHYKCKSCGNSFSQAGILKRHTHTIHDGHKGIILNIPYPLEYNHGVVFFNMTFWVRFNSKNPTKRGLFDQKMGVYSRKSPKTGLLKRGEVIFKSGAVLERIRYLS